MNGLGDLIDLMAAAMWGREKDLTRITWAGCGDYIQNRWRASSRAALEACHTAGYAVVKPELGKLSADWLAVAQLHPEATRKFASNLLAAAEQATR